MHFIEFLKITCKQTQQAKEKKEPISSSLLLQSVEIMCHEREARCSLASCVLPPLSAWTKATTGRLPFIQTPFTMLRLKSLARGAALLCKCAWARLTQAWVELKRIERALLLFLLLLLYSYKFLLVEEANSEWNWLIFKLLINVRIGLYI